MECSRSQALTSGCTVGREAKGGGYGMAVVCTALDCNDCNEGCRVQRVCSLMVLAPSAILLCNYSLHVAVSSFRHVTVTTIGVITSPMSLSISVW